MKFKKDDCVFCIKRIDGFGNEKGTFYTIIDTKKNTVVWT